MNVWQKVQLVLGIVVIITSSQHSVVVGPSLPLIETIHRQAKREAFPELSVATTSRSGEVFKVAYFEITAYSPTVEECDSSPTITASGKKVYVGGIAADLNVLPFGSQVIIPGYNDGRPCTVIDTGGMIRGNKIDVFFWTAQEAINWGRRKNVKVEIIYIPKR